MKLLDLFCCAGGAAMGYHRAGFEVTGVDIKAQPHYPFAFVQGDALEYLAARGHEYDVIHASPPCHDHSPLSALVGTDGTADLLPETREALRVYPVTVIENVASADMRADLTLCGAMFGLRTYRHRKFEIAGPLLIAQPWHPLHIARTSTKKRRRDWAAGMNISVTGDVGVWVGPAVMGIDWMNGDELSQAIPPAYTEFIGEQLLAHLTEEVPA